MDAFTNAYIDAALFTFDPNPRQGEWDDPNDLRSRLAPDALAKMEKDCAEFWADAFDSTDAELDEETAARAGRNFWLNRNGHGVGFWCNWDDPESGERLSRLSHSYGECDLYEGDDGLIHHS